MNRAERRAAAKHKHRWVLKDGYGEICDLCGAERSSGAFVCAGCGERFDTYEEANSEGRLHDHWTAAAGADEQVSGDE